MPDGDQRLEVTVCDGEGRPIRAPRLVSWLQRVAPPRAEGVLNIAFVTDARIRTLNRMYRSKDYATDVLSFPAEAQHAARSTQHRARGTQHPKAPSTQHREAPSTRHRARDTQHRARGTRHQARGTRGVLGDIVIARRVARRQAREAGHDELTELKVLALHGLLHLLGYDHEQDDGRMRRIEQRLRRAGGLPEGLIERAAR